MWIQLESVKLLSRCMCFFFLWHSSFLQSKQSWQFSQHQECISTPKMSWSGNWSREFCKTLNSHYRPQRSWGKVIYFNSVCQEFGPRGEYLGRYTLTGQVHPQVGTPPWTGTSPLGRYPQASTNPEGRYTPWEGTPPWAGRPPGRYTPQNRYTPGAGTPPVVGTSPPMVNERAVLVLLECILVGLKHFSAL